MVGFVGRVGSRVGAVHDGRGLGMNGELRDSLALDRCRGSKMWEEKSKFWRSLVCWESYPSPSVSLIVIGL